MKAEGVNVKTTMAAIVGFACLSAMSDVVFNEDFSQRSVDPSMTKRMAKHWSSCEYVCGNGTVNPLAYSYIYGKYRYSSELPYSDVSQIQDGWIMGGSARQNWVPGFFATTNSPAELPGDTDRPFAALSIGPGANYYESRVMQSIGNSFSNGTVRYTIDFRAPCRWYRKGDGVAPMIRFYPATRQMLACPDLTDGSGDSPCGFGMNGTSAGSAAFITDAYPLYIYGSGDSTSSIRGKDFGKATPLHWYRFAVDVNLDANLCSGTVRDLGDRVPDWNTTGAQIGSWQDSPLYRVLTDATGPLEGICIYNGGISSDGNSVVTNMGCFKNISVSWKAPGTPDFKPCYSNDFAVRRSCVLSQPNGAQYTHTPSGKTWDTNVVANYETFNAWGAASDERQLFSRASSNSGGRITGTDRYPVGIDGWRRLNPASGGDATVVSGGGASGKLLRLSSEGGNRFVVCAQTLGETITTGKVKLIATGRVPDGWYWSALSAIYVALGDTALYDADYDTDITQHYNAVLGFKGTINPYSCIPCANVLDRTATGQTGTALTSDNNSPWQQWFKFEIVADLDARTFDCTIQKLGDADHILDTTGETVFSAVGVPFFNNLNEIGSFTLMGYGMAKSTTWGQAVVFDAVDVWKDVGTVNEKRIYYNDFDRRERVVSTPQPDDDLADMAGLASTDGWWKRGGAFKLHSLGGNAFVSASADRDTVCAAVRSLGVAMQSDTVTVSADMRPPSKWQWLGTRDASIAVGDDSFLGGQFDGLDFLSSAAMRFGFDSGTDTVGEYGTSISRTLGIYAFGGNGKTASSIVVDATHWYRFAATANMKSHTWQLAVYDMGTQQPAANDAVGSPAAVLEGLPLGGSCTELTALAISASGLEGDAPWLGGNDPGLVLIDNITVVRQPSGMIIVIR